MKEKGKTIRFVYGIFLSLLSVFVGVLFIKQTWSIYYSAPQSPYSVESISKHFNQIALPVWLWVAAVVGNVVLSILFPEEKKRPKAYRDTALALRRAKASLLLEGDALSNVQAAGKVHQKFRRNVNIVCVCIMTALALIAFGALIGLTYLPIIRKGFFAAHDGLVDKLVQCAILAILALTAGCVAVELNENSREKERKVYSQAKIEMGKEAKKSIALPKASPVQKEEKKCKTRGVWLARAVIFTLSITLIIVGICNGGMHEMLLKAINICTQCIGLG